MNNYPKVSVVTITYSHEKYIMDTLDGILMQDYPGEIEFIISNDTSPDNTDEIIHDYLAKRNIPNNFDIKYTKHKINKGIMPNFSWALQEATGKYVAICEGDDFWIDPLKLQKQIQFLEKNKEYSLVFSNAEVEIEGNLDAKNNSRGVAKLQGSREYTPIEILENWTIPTASVVYRKTALTDRYFESVATNKNFMFGDTVLFLSLAANGKLYGVDDYFVVYRRHIGGATNFNQDLEFDKKVLRHYSEIVIIFGSKFKKVSTSRIGKYFFSIALFSLKQKDFKRFTNAMYYVLRYKPNLIVDYLKNRAK